ncbi:hypothetical protein [Rufibacter hautae]|uniref:Uncharacterized protein n=1 Tax=Rufibacter hautae TaxID=2595005 RepID=A0A5B6TCS9_9BACT|nr:hypothetical protein [Rufibacter hautae]KAA3438269.1 hypothetical protein FOA19_13500 [Rufibacter hautae]
MKKLLLLAIFSLSLLQVNAQRLTLTPYVLGLVDDSNGRNWIKDDPEESTVVDKFHSAEITLVTFLDSLIKAENKRTYDKIQFTNVKWEKPNCFYCQDFRRIHAKRLVEQMNEAYTFKWKDQVDEKQQKIYTGVLKPKAFATNQEKCSFLAGAFVRYGIIEEDQYSFLLTNSNSKYEAIIRELKALKCNIKDFSQKGEDPVVQKVSFVSTQELKAYLDKQERIRVDILKRKNKLSSERKKAQQESEFFALPQKDQK